MSAKRHSTAEEQKLVEEYLAGVPVKELMIRYQYKTKKSISDKVKKYAGANAISIARANRKNYNLDLSKIDSPFVAYFIGLLLTDGYVSGNQKFGIDLVDEDCIKFLSQATGQNYHTYQTDHQPQHRIVFSSETNIKELSRFGIISNKSLTLQPPMLLSEEFKFLPYLFRGIIDGDGHIGQTSYGAPMFSIRSGSFDFASWCKQTLEERFFMIDVGLYGEQGSWEVKTAHAKNIAILKNVIYYESYGMARKYVQLSEMFRDYNGNSQTG